MFTTTFSTSFDEVKTPRLVENPTTHIKAEVKSRKGWKLSILALIITGAFTIGALTSGSTLTYASNFFTKEDLAGMSKCGAAIYLANKCNTGGQVNIMVPASSSSSSSAVSSKATKQNSLPTTPSTVIKSSSSATALTPKCQ